MAILLHKPVGATPLQAVQKYREYYPEYEGVTLGVAGRLDPMAEGLLVVMVGEENGRQDDFMGLDKEYEAEVVLGFSTDSYDLLGVPTIRRTEVVSVERVQSVLNTLTGEIEQAYPPYSAVRVDGKPLFWWARQARLDEVAIPVKKRTIYELALSHFTTVPLKEFQQLIHERISLVEGDFRQDEIMEAWQDLLEHLPETIFQTFKLKIRCSSGTFVRSLVNQIGQSLGVGATTTAIVRTRVGPYSISQALELS